MSLSSPPHPEEIGIEALLIFPHQLFASNAALARSRAVFLIEDALYFKQYRFHKQKLALHRASLRAHAAYLQEWAAKVTYLDADNALSMNEAIGRIAQTARTLHYIDAVDDWLTRRLAHAAALHECVLVRHPTDMFLSSVDTLATHFDRPKLSMASFYTAERRRLGILVSNGKPVGGKWSLDSENRKRLPARITLPPNPIGRGNEFISEAHRYVDGQFGLNPGRSQGTLYPVTHADARQWLSAFLEQRLEWFGAYEDAISASEGILFHSLLTPMLNTGLLTPRQVVDATLLHAQSHSVPLNSLEGFLRQIIGWREFVRGTYEFHGRAQRTTNFWKHSLPLPQSFWTGHTGIDPVDTVIARVLDSGYAHHIERLMILANFMLLCEFAPDDVYRWFMEMFVDSYDWVMVPNVYGMGLHADGGLMMTKPYISSSSYILRMSNFKRGPWCAIWDGLFWRFIARHRRFFSANPRLGVMVKNLDRMESSKLKTHITTAEAWLARVA